MTDLDTIQRDNEPMRRALAMARALAQFLHELDHDEPGDDESRFAPLLRDAQAQADTLVTALRRLTRRPR